MCIIFWILRHINLLCNMQTIRCLLLGIFVSAYVWTRNIKTVKLSFSFAATQQKERNVKFTYRHSNCSRRLLPAPRKCLSFHSCGLPYRSYCTINFACRMQIFLHRTTDRCDCTLFRYNFNYGVTWDKLTYFRCAMLHCLKNVIGNTVNLILGIN